MSNDEEQRDERITLISELGSFNNEFESDYDEFDKDDKEDNKNDKDDEDDKNNKDDESFEGVLKGLNLNNLFEGSNFKSESDYTNVTNNIRLKSHTITL